MSEPHQPDRPPVPPTFTAAGLRRLETFLAAEAVASSLPVETSEDRATQAVLDLLHRLAPPDPASQPRRFGRFILHRLLGQGRFGIVFLAGDPSVPRAVALKWPQPGVLLDAGLLERFWRDSEAAGLLDHPGIVPVHEAGKIDAIPYIVSAFVHGPSLADWLQQLSGPVPIPSAVRLLSQLARAVQYAHDRGVLHCDLKPANILLQPTGEAAPPSATAPLEAFVPRITDFGLARLLDREPGLTQTYLVTGSLPYMAPEQARGERRGLTARCDLHALGAILFELLTGQPPYTGRTESEVLRRLLDEEPPQVHRLRPEVPRDLEAIVHRCLEKEPARRYASAAELTDDLERFQRGEPTRARPVGVAARLFRWARRRPVTAGMATLVLLSLTLAMGLAGYFLRARAAFDRELEMEKQRTQLHEFHALLEQVRQRRTERLRGWAAENLVALQQLAALPAADDYQTELRTEAAAALAMIELGPARVLHEGYRANRLIWSPDGRWLALGEHYPVLKEPILRVRLVDGRTGKLWQDLTCPVDREWEEVKRKGQLADSISALVFSPDGRWLIAGTRSGWLMRWDLRASPPTMVRWDGHRHDPEGEMITALSFTEDGSLLLSSTDYMIRRWSARANWQGTGEPVRSWLPQTQPVIPDLCWFFCSDFRAVPFDVRLPRGWRHDPGQPERVPAYYAVSRDGRLGTVFRFTWPFFGWMVRMTTGDHLLPLTAESVQAHSERVNVSYGLDDRLVVNTLHGVRHLGVWDTARGRMLESHIPDAGSFHAQFAPVDKRLAVCQALRTMVHEILDRGVRTTLALQPGPLRDFDLSRDGRYLLTIAISDRKKSEIHVYNRRPDGSYRLRWLGRRTSSVCPLVALHDDGQQFAYTHREGPDDTTELQRWHPAQDLSNSILEDSNDLRIDSAGRVWVAETHSIVVYRPADQTARVIYRNSTRDKRAGLVFQRLALGSRWTAAGRRDGKVFLFTASGEARAVWQVFQEQRASSVALSQDESLLLVGSSHGRARVLHIPSGESAFDLEGQHHGSVEGVAFGPGSTLITASSDQTIKLWSATGQLLVTLREQGPVNRLAVSSDGAELTVLVDHELGLRRWDLAALHARLQELGLDPGFHVQPPRRSAPAEIRRGLTAEHYRDRNWDDLDQVRQDAYIDWDWQLGRASHDQQTDHFSLRWRGYLRPPRAGRYLFRVEVDDDVQLWIDGRLVCTRNNAGPKVAQGEADLPDEPVSFRLDYAERIHTAYCRLLWRRADTPGPFQPVPPEAFFLDRDSALRAGRPFGPEVPRGATLEVLSADTKERIAGPMVRPHVDGTLPDEVRRALPANRPLLLRYAGVLHTPQPGRYSLDVTGPGRARLWLSAKEVKLLPMKAGEPRRYTSDLPPDPIPFRLEYTATAAQLAPVPEGRPMALRWSRAAENCPTPLLIPQAVLFPDEAAARRAGVMPGSG